MSAVDPPTTPSTHGDVLTAISDGMVALLKEFYGRGPTRAKSYYQDDLVVCLLRGGFSQVEQTLWPGPLHEGHGTGQPILDAGMSDEQREALGAILSGENGGTFYGILAEIIDTFHDPVVADIDIEIDVEGRRARCAVDGVLETETEPIAVIGEDESTDYSIQVRIPNGFEYDECEVAQTKILKGTGDIKFDHQGSHSSLAHVARTPGN